MDVRWIAGLVVAFVYWASHTALRFTLMGHLFVLPVLVLIAFLLALVLLALIAYIVRSLAADGFILGGNT